VNPTDQQQDLPPLPELSKLAKRILELRWRSLLDTYRLNAEAISRYAGATEMTRKVALSKPLDSTHTATRHIQGWLTSYLSARRECGISSSEELAKASFHDLATEYLNLWSPGAGCEIFECQLQLIQERILDEVASIWRQSDATRRWYEAVCAPAVRTAVSGKLGEFTRKARDAELVFLVRTKIDELPQPLHRAGPTEVNPQGLPESIAAVETGPSDGERSCPRGDESPSTVPTPTVAENLKPPVQDQSEEKSGRNQPMTADPTFWRIRREELETLPPGEYSLIWSTRRPISFADQLLPSQWSWWRFPDDSLRARLSAIALKCAKALGRDSEDGWFDELRQADFVEFKLTGCGSEKQPDGSMVDHEYGPLEHIVKHSITLCHVFEAAGSPRPMNPAPIEGDGQKRQGRPATIPDERKQAAVECKANGGTNRDAAMLIYDSRYPSPQQVKNVSAILRNHQQRSTRRNSSGSARPETSSKSQQK